MRYGALFLTLLATACKPDDRPPVPPDLQLVSAGKEPLRKLRYSASKGSTTTLEIAINMDVTAGSMESALPTVVMTMSLLVEDVLVNGKLKLRTTVTEAVARDRDDSYVSLGALTDPLTAMKGVVMTATLSPSGYLSRPAIESGDKPLPDTVKTHLAALSASFENVVMPLPDEPIGVGAVWRNSRVVEQSGMRMTAVNTIAITALDGNKVAYTVDTQLTGADQTAVASGVNVDVKDIIGTGTGHGSVDLHTLATTTMLETDLRSDMTAPGEAHAMAMRMRATTKITSR